MAGGPKYLPTALPLRSFSTASGTDEHPLKLTGGVLLVAAFVGDLANADGSMATLLPAGTFTASGSEDWSNAACAIAVVADGGEQRSGNGGGRKEGEGLAGQDRAP